MPVNPGSESGAPAGGERAAERGTEERAPGRPKEGVRRRALLSVADKRGIADLGRALHRQGWEVVSTGSTATVLREAGVPVTPVSEVTGFPELLDGRVKTLHPAVHAGILARRRHRPDMEALAERGFVPIDLVAVNLYPFAEAAAAGVSGDELLEHIDIGGPALIRAAAKNWPDVTVVVDPDDYPRVVAALEEAGEVPRDLRRQLAVKAFAHTAYYDAVIAATLGGGPGGLPGAAAGPDRCRDGGDPWPEGLAVPLRRARRLRYGENPHQSAALYVLALPDPAGRAGRDGRPGAGVAGARQLMGKELSYNNLLDADAAWRAVWEFAEPAAVAVKHGTPCGIGTAATLAEAFTLARDADPESIFGGIVALNRSLDEETARRLGEIFLEVIIAPAVEPAALERLSSRKNLRVLVADPQQSVPALEVRTISGGLLLQEADRAGHRDDSGAWRIVTRRQPGAAELELLRFAWRAVKHCRSNAIVVAGRVPGGLRTVGIGAGQTSRVRAVEQALAQAGGAAAGAVLASDGFFPFPDSVERAAAAGVAAIVQPGGSVRDEEVIAAADRHGIAMVFTGERHFRH